jgi:heme/copper-type cytochrome/quinol oxidase subunit 4
MMMSQPSAKQFFRSRTGLVLLVFLAIAAFFLITEHTAHLFGALPYVLLLSCLALHFFMHRGHGGHAGHGRGDERHVEEEK